MAKYYLNLNMQSNGDYEVHKGSCSYVPITNYEYLGLFYNCDEAVAEARSRHPFKKINGCYYCSKPCHTT